jgi:ElaB/YqjD/DUF883 family membrane-anchored ribosome-binding protein
MFDKRASRRHQAERVAGQAWDHLTTAMDQASDRFESSARSARKSARSARESARSARERAGSGAKEARRRANRAMDALAGREPKRPWGSMAIVAVTGAVVGWLAAAFRRQFLPRARRAPVELETFPEDVSSELLSRP